MTRNFIALSAAAAIVLLIGCAHNPQQARITASVDVPNSAEGANVFVAVRVVDERPSKSLGRRADAYGPSGEITSPDDLELVVQRQVTSALRMKGFIPTEASRDSVNSLTVELRLLEYSVSQSLTFGLHVRGAVKVVALRSSERYEKIYRAEVEERVFVVPPPEVNERLINDALGKTLNEIFVDSQLFSFLANKR